MSTPNEQPDDALTATVLQFLKSKLSAEDLRALFALVRGDDDVADSAMDAAMQGKVWGIIARNRAERERHLENLFPGISRIKTV
jgi:hypothetical protein